MELKSSVILGFTSICCLHIAFKSLDFIGQAQNSLFELVVFRFFFSQQRLQGSDGFLSRQRILESGSASAIHSSGQQHIGGDGVAESIEKFVLFFLSAFFVRSHRQIRLSRLAPEERLVLSVGVPCFCFRKRMIEAATAATSSATTSTCRTFPKTTSGEASLFDPK